MMQDDNELFVWIAYLRDGFPEVFQANRFAIDGVACIWRDTRPDLLALCTFLEGYAAVLRLERNSYTGFLRRRTGIVDTLI